MYKIIVAGLVAVMLNGCSWQQVENTWTKGKKVGATVLSDSTKDKLKPAVGLVEGAYSKYKTRKLD